MTSFWSMASRLLLAAGDCFVFGIVDEDGGSSSDSEEVEGMTSITSPLICPERRAPLAMKYGGSSPMAVPSPLMRKNVG